MRASLLPLLLPLLLAGVARAQDNDAECKFDADGNSGTANVFSGALELTGECTCGSSDCGTGNKKYCWPASDFDPTDPAFLCKEAPICRVNTINKQPAGYCYCGDTKCSVKQGAFCTPAGKCQKYPFCPAMDGSQAAPSSCKCGDINCETAQDNDDGVETGLYCHESNGVFQCRHIPTCEHKDGLERNTEACACGKSDCDTVSGEFCTMCNHPDQMCEDQPAWAAVSVPAGQKNQAKPWWTCPSSASASHCVDPDGGTVCNPHAADRTTCRNKVDASGQKCEFWPGCASRDAYEAKVLNTYSDEDQEKLDARPPKILESEARKKWKGLEYNAAAHTWRPDESCVCTEEEVRGRCRHAPCVNDDFDGNLGSAAVNNMACRCNNTDCVSASTTGLYCNRLEFSNGKPSQAGRCRKAPCLYNDGVTPNDEDCSCGATDCLESTNKLVCNNATSTCDYPICSNMDGTAANPKSCWCGERGETLSGGDKGEFCFDPKVFVANSGGKTIPACAIADGSAANTVSCVCNNTICELGKDDGKYFSGTKQNPKPAKDATTGQTTGMHCYMDQSTCSICPMGKFLDASLAATAVEGLDWGADTTDEDGVPTPDTPDTLIEYVCRFCPAGFAYDGEKSPCKPCPDDEVQPAEEAFFAKCMKCNYYEEEGTVTAGHLGWYHTGDPTKPCELSEQGYPVWAISLVVVVAVSLIAYGVIMMLRMNKQGKGGKPKAIALVPVSADGSAA